MNPLLFLGGVGFQELIILLIWIALLGVWFWALVDCLKSRFNESIDKFTWVLVILFVPFIGGILYYAIGQKRRV
jgi:cbb3-type cytochrome oxidase subunit 3